MREAYSSLYLNTCTALYLLLWRHFNLSVARNRSGNMWNNQDTDLRLRDCELCRVVLVFFHKKSSRSWPFTNIEVCGFRFIHIFFIDNNLLMGKIYSHYIYLPAYLKLMNINTTRIPNVRDNNLID